MSEKQDQIEVKWEPCREGEIILLKVPEVDTQKVFPDGARRPIINIYFCREDAVKVLKELLELVTED